jgi:hypothetical protein
LPAYAPELNPAENIWQYLRDNALSHQVWDTHEAIVDACCNAWNALIATPNVITSILLRVRLTERGLLTTFSFGRHLGHVGATADQPVTCGSRG